MDLVPFSHSTGPSVALPLHMFPISRAESSAGHGHSQRRHKLWEVTPQHRVWHSQGMSILQGLGYPGAKRWLEGTCSASRAVPAHKTHTKHSLTSQITPPQPSLHPTHTQITQVPLQGMFSTRPYRVKLHSLKNSILTPRRGAEGKHASPQSHTPAFGQYLT